MHAYGVLNAQAMQGEILVRATDVALAPRLEQHLPLLFDGEFVQAAIIHDIHPFRPTACHRESYFHDSWNKARTSVAPRDPCVIPTEHSVAVPLVSPVVGDRLGIVLPVCQRKRTSSLASPYRHTRHPSPPPPFVIVSDRNVPTASPSE